MLISETIHRDGKPIQQPIYVDVITIHNGTEKAMRFMVPQDSPYADPIPKYNVSGYTVQDLAPCPECEGKWVGSYTSLSAQKTIRAALNDLAHAGMLPSISHANMQKIQDEASPLLGESARTK